MFDQDTSMNLLLVLIWGLVVLFGVRRFILWRKDRALDKRIEKMKQTQALRMTQKLNRQQAEANDPWSRTCSHDTIQRELDPAFRKKLDRLGLYE